MEKIIQKILIHSTTIQLDQLIKWIGITQTGGQARFLIDNGKVSVNGTIVLVRRKKVNHDDMVNIDGNEYRIINEGI